MSVDLHIHSTISDGSQTPEQIVDVAVAKGLSAISITDHEHVAAYEPAVAAAGSRLTVLPGIEISTQVNNTEVHILGYLFDHTNPELCEAMSRVRADRFERAEAIVQRLRELGVTVNFNIVREIAGDGSIGRPHIAKALVEAGYVTSQKDAFHRYLRNGGPAYVPRMRLEPEDVIELIKAAQGIAILAHPGLCNDDDAVRQLIDMGIDGLEVWHVTHTDFQTRKYTAMAAEKCLLITGGTDSHGPEGSTPVAIGSVEVPDTVVKELCKQHSIYFSHS